MFSCEFCEISKNNFSYGNKIYKRWNIIHNIEIRDHCQVWFFNITWFWKNNSLLFPLKSLTKKTGFLMISGGTEVYWCAQACLILRSKMVLSLKACKFTKNRIQYRGFSVKISIFLRTPFCTEHLCRLLLWINIEQVLHFQNSVF